MTAKEYLNRGYRLDCRINGKLAQMEQLRTMAQRITPTYGGEVVSHSRNIRSHEDIMIKIIDAEKELNAQIDALVDIKKELEQTIALVADEDCRILLELRYLSMKSWKDIGVALEKSKSHVFRLHNQALALVETILRTREAAYA